MEKEEEVGSAGEKGGKGEVNAFGRGGSEAGKDEGRGGRKETMGEEEGGVGERGELIP